MKFYFSVCGSGVEWMIYSYEPNWDRRILVGFALTRRQLEHWGFSVFVSGYRLRFVVLNGKTSSEWMLNAPFEKQRG